MKKTNSPNGSLIDEEGDDEYAALYRGELFPNFVTDQIDGSNDRPAAPCVADRRRRNRLKSQDARLHPWRLIGRL